MQLLPSEVVSVWRGAGTLRHRSGRSGKRTGPAWGPVENLPSVTEDSSRDLGQPSESQRGSGRFMPPRSGELTIVFRSRHHTIHIPCHNEFEACLLRMRLSRVHRRRVKNGRLFWCLLFFISRGMF